uniref:mu-type opioid receptor-like n=1 Tax=Doryrhamphus excisus TaxID=161450 RepID=UPI0025ADDE4B|nr:mu-type opioid receptor-like [Doryrhamphus excisus]XP_057922593.1 mu-type opioid receptor-like [Doryrhamphus excisus]
MNSSDLNSVACFISTPMRIPYMLYNITNMLLLTLFISILYAACHQTSSFTHSDMFTFHMAAIELIGVVSSAMRFYGVLTEDVSIITIGNMLFFFIWYGQVFLHMLTCMDRYLAVVHPVTYMGLKQKQGLRNITIAGVWLICILQSMFAKYNLYSIFMDIGILCLALIVVTVCSLLILCALIGPMKGSKRRNGVNQSKRRAFHTILVILLMLFLKFIMGLMVSVLLSVFRGFNIYYCVVIVMEAILGLPSSLVLPLLFLHKTWPPKFFCCTTSANQQQT